MAIADCSTPTASAENLLPWFFTRVKRYLKGSNLDTLLLIKCSLRQNVSLDAFISDLLYIYIYTEYLALQLFVAKDGKKT